MQSIWSRAAQTRISCQCGSCIHPGTPVIRRTTTAAARRRLKFGDVFTACYSTILVSAAVADAKIKDDRRKEWDRAIAEAKGRADLPTTRVGCSDGRAINSEFLDSTRTLTNGVIAGQSDLFTAVPQGLSTTSEDFYRTTIKETSISSKLRALERQIRKAQEDDPKVVKDVHQAEWIDEPPNADIAYREPIRRIHLDKMEVMVAKLVRELLSKTTVFSKSISKESLDMIRLPDEMKLMAQRIEQLYCRFTPLPAYTWKSDKSVAKQRLDLHDAIRSICRESLPSRSGVDLIVAKICYNLLISTAPPCIVTYNILIGELSRVKALDAAQAVVDSFFESKLAPNSTTACLMLDLQVAKGDRDGFRNIIQRMRATKGDMHVQKIPVAFLSQPAWMNWALETKVVIHKGQHVRAKMARDDSVFDSMIRGSLKLLGVRDAIRYIRAALREKKVIQETTFVKVVQACQKQQDYRAAIGLLQSILDLFIEGGDAVLIQLSKTTRWAMYQLTGLCGIDLSQLSTASVPKYLSQVGLENMKRFMDIESVQSKLELSAQRIDQLTATFDQFLADPTRCHIYISGGQSRALERRKSKNNNQARWNVLRTQESKLLLAQECLRKHTLQLVSIALESLSERSRKEYKRVKGRPGANLSCGQAEVLGNLALILHIRKQEVTDQYNESRVASSDIPTEGSGGLGSAVQPNAVEEIVSDEHSDVTFTQSPMSLQQIATAQSIPSQSQNRKEQRPRSIVMPSPLLALPSIYRQQETSLATA